MGVQCLRLLISTAAGLALTPCQGASTLSAAWGQKKKKDPLTLDEHHFEQLHKYTKTRRVSKGQMGGNDFIKPEDSYLGFYF